MSVIRILVADDQAVVRDGLVTLLGLEPDLEVVAEAADGAEAVRAARELRPDVVLMDLRMPLLDGAEATSRILAAVPGTAVLVLTTYADDASIAGALRAGARGYLTKDAGRRQLVAAVRAAASGQATFAPEVGERLVRGFAPAAARTAEGLRHRFPVLTPREAEVLLHVAAGRSNAEIAARLHLSVPTVKSHINAIFAKLQVRDRAQAVALALAPDGP
ncbi:MAG TPA: response regulator transcription factor [Amnibacterium sp.]|nr:response regulator transcription factor [Amnibacterium sp.]